MYHQGWLCLAAISGLALRGTVGQCEEGNPLYPFGHEQDDAVAIGDDGPPGILLLEDSVPGGNFRFYNHDYTKVHLNLNGQVSFGDAHNPVEDMAMTDFFPSPVARYDPPFMTAFWNDIFLDANDGTLFYRASTDPAILSMASVDIGFKEKDISPTQVVIATWYKVSSFNEIITSVMNETHAPLYNTFQVVLVMDNDGLSFAMFHYYVVDWYLAHSLPAVAMFNRDRSSSIHTNLFASGSELMLDLDEMCANAGMYGRVIIQTNLERIKILDRPSPSVLESCYLRDNALYHYGTAAGDDVITMGDDGPSTKVTLGNPALFYGEWHSDLFININGPISFTHEFLNFWPKTRPVDDPPFMAAFWNDMMLTGDEGRIFYRVSTDSATLARFTADVSPVVVGPDFNPAELLIVTWHKVKMYHAFEDDPHNTFQVVFGYQGERSYTLFIFAYIGWYQDAIGNFAVSMFNRGDSSKVSLDIGPVPGPEFFFRHQRGNSVNKPGMFIYETHPPFIMDQKPTCVCKVDKKKWVTTFDGKRHEFKHAQKNRMSMYLDNTDPCKFQLSIITEASEGETFKVTWVAFSFGIHEQNDDKFDKSLAFERHTNGTIHIRGRGHAGATEIHAPFEWRSSDNRTHMSVFGDEYSGFVVNSTTCPYRLFYGPRCADPVVVFTIARAHYPVSNLIGMCQDCDGNPDNDYRPCTTDPVEDWKFWEAIPDVSGVCIDDLPE